MLGLRQKPKPIQKQPPVAPPALLGRRHEPTPIKKQPAAAPPALLGRCHKPKPIKKRPAAAPPALGASSNSGVRVSGRVEEPKGVQASGREEEPKKYHKFVVPEALQTRLRTWAGRMKDTIGRVCAKSSIFRSVGVLWSSFPVRRLGTDCSGAEAPVWAAKALQIPHRHVFSCDWNESCRDFITSTSPPYGPVFSDMLKRSMADLPDMDIYVCGFPCTPYSNLRGHSTRLLKEAAAKPYFKVKQVIKAKLPQLFILENAMGLRKVMAQVVKDMEAMREYFVFILMIDPKDLGEPIARPRYYIIGLRRDVCLTGDTSQMGSFFSECMQAMKTPVRGHAKDILMNTAATKVQEVLKARKMKAGSLALRCAKKAGSPGVRASRGFEKTGSPGVQAIEGLTTPRTWTLWNTVGAKHGTKELIADVSQSEGRVSTRTDGCLPTVTPGGIVCVSSLGRIIIGAEKLLVHGFPLHEMKIPQHIPDRELGRMGGNTMHLMCIGLALSMSSCLLRDEVPAPSRTSTPGDLSKVVFVGTPDPRKASKASTKPRAFGRVGVKASPKPRAARGSAGSRKRMAFASGPLSVKRQRPAC